MQVDLTNSTTENPSLINDLRVRSVAWSKKNPNISSFIIGAGSLALGVLAIKLVASAWMNYQMIQMGMYVWNLPLKHAIIPLAIQAGKGAAGIGLGAVSLKGLQIGLTRLGIGIGKLRKRSIEWLNNKTPLERKLIIGTVSLVLGIVGIKLLASAWVNYKMIQVALYVWNVPLKHAITPIAIEAGKAAVGLGLSAISLKGLQIIVTKK